MKHTLTAARLRMAGLVLIVVALGTAAAVHASPAHGHEAGLTINWWQWDSHAPPLGWFLLDFVLFVGGLVYFTAKPLSQAFAQRHLSIKRAIGDAASAHAKASSRHHEWRDKLAKVEAEIRALTQTTQQDGEAERAQIVREAQAYAARMQQDSEQMGAQELQRARERLRQSVLQAALERAWQLLEEQLTDADRQRLLDQSIAELEKGGDDRAVRSTVRAASRGEA